jgi:FK506-binding protein 1
MPVEIVPINPGDKINFPKRGQIVSIHYEIRLHPETKNRQTGKILDPEGKLLDSSRARDAPFEFVLGAGIVLNGIEEALPRMSLGQKSNLIIPCEQAFGKTGIREIIPGGATAVVEVELLGIKTDW